MTNVVLIENEMLTASAIRSSLEQYGKFQVLNIFTDGYSFLEAIESLTYDLVLMDIGMPMVDGLSLLMQLKEVDPKAKVIMLSSHADADNITLAFQRGASGFITKSAEFEEIFKGVEEVLEGNIPFFSQQIEKVVKTQVKASLKSGRWPKISYITPTEKLILQHLAQGLTTKEVATTLQLSSRTIDCHRRNLMEKLEVSNSTSLITTVIKRGLINI